MLFEVSDNYIVHPKSNKVVSIGLLAKELK